MTPNLSIREKVMQLLAADTATLASVDAMKVHLVKATFTPSEDMDILDFELADFDGSTALEAGTGTQPESLVPGTNDSVIHIKPPAGGWRWETTGTTNLPQTIYGYILTNNDSSTVYAAEVFSEEITLSKVNQSVSLPSVKLTQQAGSMS